MSVGITFQLRVQDDALVSAEEPSAKCEVELQIGVRLLTTVVVLDLLCSHALHKLLKKRLFKLQTKRVTDAKPHLHGTGVEPIVDIQSTIAIVELRVQNVAIKDPGAIFHHARLLRPHVTQSQSLLGT